MGTMGTLGTGGTIPSVAPSTEIEEDAFMELDSIISSGKLTSAIRCGENLAEHKKDILKDCKAAFSERDLKNWATLMFFLEQVWYLFYLSA